MATRTVSQPQKANPLRTIGVCLKKLVVLCVSHFFTLPGQKPSAHFRLVGLQKLAVSLRFLKLLNLEKVSHVLNVS